MLQHCVEINHTETLEAVTILEQGLVADKLNVESSLRVRMLQIREREFDLFLDRIRTIGTLATVLAGLGHAGLLYTKYIDHNLCGTHEGFCAELTYPFFTCIALGASIITMWGCVLLVTQARARHPRRFSETCP